MLIQDKASWDSDVDRRLGLLKTLGVDCVSMDIPDGPRADGLLAGGSLRGPKGRASWVRRLEKNGCVVPPCRRF